MTEAFTNPQQAARHGTVSGTPSLILRAEGAALLAASLIAYAQTDASWWLFAALILVPDIFMLGYLISARIGAAAYNLGHTTLLPLALVVAGWALAAQLALAIGLIWLAHVGMDRMVGYGLKYPDAFRHTHLSLAA